MTTIADQFDSTEQFEQLLSLAEERTYLSEKQRSVLERIAEG